MTALESELAALPLFSGLEPGHLAIMAGLARPVEWKAGGYIFREGDPACEFYVIRRGRVALEMAAAGQGVLTVQTLREGDLLGLSWVSGPRRWMFDARALEMTMAYVFDAQAVLEACDADPVLGYRLMRRLVHTFEQRLQATRLQLMDVYGVDA